MSPILSLSMTIELWVVGDQCRGGDASLLAIGLQFAVDKFAAIVCLQGVYSFLEFVLYHFIQSDYDLCGLVFVRQVESEAKT